MNVPAPHFLLYAEAAQAADSAASDAGRWRFVLRLPGGETALEAADEEPEAGPERLELLAVVRGLEALDSPSQVTLLTGSRHIHRGLESGLSQWRENDWQWDRYGRMTPVKNGDLWQRLDRLLDIHSLECRPTRLEKVDDLVSPPPAPARQRSATRRSRAGGSTFRIDAPHATGPQKAETPNPKFRSKPNLKGRTAPNRPGFFQLLKFLLGVCRWVKPTPRRGRSR
jgi:ribonuclease HI